MPYRQPEPLHKGHVLGDFDCGKPALNEWLQKYGLASEASRSARVFVTTEDRETVVGYYALAGSSVEPKDATARLAKGQATERPIPAVLLARLAVDANHQSRGVGRSLLRDAMVRSLAAAENIGLRAMLVHAKDNEARAWYEKYGFEASPTDDLHLLLLMKDIQATVGA